jgi:hypothetical protein
MRIHLLHKRITPLCELNLATDPRFSSVRPFQLPKQIAKDHNRARRDHYPIGADRHETLSRGAVRLNEILDFGDRHRARPEKKPAWSLKRQP